MYFGNIFDDFKMRYGEECRRAYFCGIPLVFFAQNGVTLGCALSAGGAVALRERADDRLVAEFSDNSDYLSCAVSEFSARTDSKIIKFLTEIEKYGAHPHGAQLLVCYNTDLPRPFIPLFCGAARGLCENAPPSAELIKYFPNSEKNMLSVLSRANHLTLSDGQNLRYLPFENAKVKIVLSCISEKVKTPPAALPKEAAETLLRGDIESFGRLLNRETDIILSRGKNRRTEQLFRTAVRLSDAYGSGIFPDGGIFSIVENRRVDAFMHNLGTEYGKYFGARPNFYVTQTADSTVEIPTV